MVECKQAITSIAILLCILDAPEAVTSEIVGHNEEIETEIGMKLIQESSWLPLVIYACVLMPLCLMVWLSVIKQTIVCAAS